MTEDRFNIVERFGCSDTQELCAEIRRLREALNDIVNASRDDGLSTMVNWMRGRALDALLFESWDE